MAKKKDVQKESEERIKVAEDHVWNGIKAGIEATKNQLTIPELLNILLRIVFQYNKMNLNYTQDQVHKDSVQMENTMKSVRKLHGDKKQS